MLIVLVAAAPLLVVAVMGTVSDDSGNTPQRVEQQADAISGNWSGSYFDEGQAFTITLDIAAGCRVGQRCGEVYVSKHPCAGGWYFVGRSGDAYQFRVDDFTTSSSPVCTAGSEYFLTPEGGRLIFTTYANGPSGTLNRV